MTVDRAWVKRNLGFDPIDEAPPINTFAYERAATHRTEEDFQREIIDFDSASPAGTHFFAYSKATGLSRYVDVTWPPGLAPLTGQPNVDGTGPLPKADVLVVTWTVDEGHALSRVLTPGKDSRNDYIPYTHNFEAIVADMRHGCPALELGRLGAFWTTQIGGTSVVVFKSDSHMSQDGPKLPNAKVWRQIIQEVSPKLVITTGTAGGIGASSQVGDVVVSPVVRFDCKSKFQAEAFAQATYTSLAANQARWADLPTLIEVNASQLPPENARPPQIVVCNPGDLSASVVTTDFFGFDTTDDHYHLQGLGAVSEMGDAALGLVASEMQTAAPRYLAIRNVSDPQINATGLSLSQQASVAATIYKGFGRWSSVCSALVCWAVIAAE